MAVNRFLDSTRRSGASCGTVLGALAVLVAAYAVAQTAQADAGRHEPDVVVAPDPCAVCGSCRVYGRENEGLAAALVIAKFDGEDKYVVGYSLKWTRPRPLWRLKSRCPVGVRYFDCKHRFLTEEDHIISLDQGFLSKTDQSDGDLLVIEPPKEARYVDINLGNLVFTPRVDIPAPKPAHGK